MSWIKSSYSNGSGGSNCVEVVPVYDPVPGLPEVRLVAVHVRDSKNPNGPVLTFTSDEWEAFVKGAQAGEFVF